jgi:hypothetical protein
MSSLKLAIKLFEPRTMIIDAMLKQGMRMGCVFGIFAKDILI